MIKKVYGFVCIILTHGLFAASSAEIKTKDMGDNLNKTGPRSAAFFPASSRFREIYGNVGTSLQVEDTRTWKDLRNLEVWGNVEWIFMHGKSRQHCGSSHINILNISLGPKVIGKIYRDYIFLYAGIGPDVGIVFIENKIRCCGGCDSKFKESVCRAGIGGIFKSGGQIYFTPNFFLDLFADYLYLPIHFNRTVDVGGCKVGGGLGARY